jgi:hypothetical protein
MHWNHFIKLYKNTRKTISWDYPFKSIFTAIIVSTKSWPPPPKEWRSVIVCYKQKGDGLEGDWRKSADGCRAFLIVGPIPAKVKKLGLLSIYKFSLATRKGERGKGVSGVVVKLEAYGTYFWFLSCICFVSFLQFLYANYCICREACRGN